MSDALWGRIRAAADNDRPTAKLGEALEEVDTEAIREWANALTEVADALDDAKGAIESWQWAEGREDKADARAEAVDALGRAVDAYDAIPVPEADLLVDLLADHVQASQAEAS